MSAVRPYFEGEEASPTSGTDAYFLRDARWHYVWYPKVGDDQLYDVTVDPNEQHNIVAQNPERQQELRERIQTWWKNLK